MRKVVKVNELVGHHEIATRVGVRENTIAQWRIRHADFPAPVADLKMGPVWSWPDVEEWMERTGRL
jgi:chromosome partitioning protein